MEEAVKTANDIRAEIKAAHDRLNARFEVLVGDLIEASEKIKEEFPSKIGPALRALRDAGFKASPGPARGRAKGTSPEA